jgi:HSP20 family molecular chaperone IbpA
MTYNSNLSNLLTPILGRVNYYPTVLDRYEKSIGDLFAFSSAQFSSRMKLDETDSQWELSLELPGYANKDIEVSVRDSILEVRAKNEKYGETTKTLELWQGIQTEGISGKMQDGILIVNLPKEQKVVKKIPVD